MWKNWLPLKDPIDEMLPAALEKSGNLIWYGEWSPWVLESREVGSAEGVSPSLVGRGLGSGPCLLQKIFLSGNGAFWCILGACFNVMLYKACKTESKSSFVCQLPIGQLSHMADVSSMISYTYIRVSSQPVRHTCSLYYLTIGVYRKKQWEQRSRCIKKEWEWHSRAFLSDSNPACSVQKTVQ